MFIKDVFQFLIDKVTQVLPAFDSDIDDVVSISHR